MQETDEVRREVRCPHCGGGAARLQAPALAGEVIGVCLSCRRSSLLSEWRREPSDDVLRREWREFCGQAGWNDPEQRLPSPGQVAPVLLAALRKEER